MIVVQEVAAIWIGGHILGEGRESAGPKNSYKPDPLPVCFLGPLSGSPSY